MPTVIYNRLKPFGVDIVDIARRRRVMLIGYPLVYGSYDASNILGCVADPSRPEDFVRRIPRGHPNARQYTKNLNLVRDLAVGDIVLVPRPQSGLIYAARIAGPFRLEADDELTKELTELAAHKTVGTSEPPRFAAEVSQRWETTEYVALGWNTVPGWIRRSLFGMASYNRIARSDDGDPYEVIGALLSGARVQWPWTVEMHHVLERLLHFLTPASFEHLIVSLLQLERPELVWQQVGGSGDGGVDGIGSTDEGEVTCLVQCKFSSVSATPDFETAAGKEKIVASLCGPGLQPLSGVRVINRQEVAELVLKHAARLPLAISMRIGPSGAAAGKSTPHPNSWDQFSQIRRS